MKRDGAFNLFREIVAALFVLLFLYTGIEKLGERGEFEAAMSRSELIEPIASILSWTVPVAELIIVLMLFIPALRRAGLIAATVMMSLFTAYIVYILNYYEKLPCTCGGVIEQMTWKEHMILNIAFLVLGAIAIVPHKSLNRFIAINRRSRIPV